MATITFLIEDNDHRKIEKHKWDLLEWERVEKTWSYLRRKYGRFINKFIKNETQPKDDNNWVSD
jgi:hypothetical protein